MSHSKIWHAFRYSDTDVFSRVFQTLYVSCIFRCLKSTDAIDIWVNDWSVLNWVYFVSGAILDIALSLGEALNTYEHISRFKRNYGHRVELVRGSKHMRIFSITNPEKAFSNSLYICVVVQVDGGIVLLCRSPRLHYRACYLRTSSKSGSCAHKVVCASRVHEYSVVRPEVTVSESYWHEAVSYEFP